MSMTYNGTDVQAITYNGYDLEKVIYNGETVFEKEDYSDKPYLSFIEEDGQQFTLLTKQNEGSYYSKKKTWDGKIWYSYDGKTWSTWTGITELSSSADGKLYLRGKGNTYLTTWTDRTVYFFSFYLSDNKKIRCIGNIENLFDYELVEQGAHPSMADYSCRGMFYGCSSLTEAPALPATTLTNRCYYNMFQGCTGLTEAPALPATTLTTYCYAAMFKDCTGLTKAPALPATTLASNCYEYIFKDCTSLTGIIHCPASVSSSSMRLTVNPDNVPSTVTVLYDL